MKTARLLVLSILALAGCKNTLDDGLPRLYACDRSAGLNSCPGNWRCGFSGYCQDPTRGQAYECDTWEDCSANWNCGADRVCYDRALAAARSCRPALDAIADAGDCAPGWRCGREELCHPLDAGAGYQCVNDLDCEATWRCGPEGKCVDVATQGLGTGSATFTVSKVSPLLPVRSDLLHVRVRRGDQAGQLATNRMVFTTGGQLTVATNSALTTFPFTSSRDSIPLARPAHALADLEDSLLVTDSAGLSEYGNALDGGTVVQLQPLLANAELRYADEVFDKNGLPVTDEELAAFSGSKVAVCGRGTLVKVCDPTDFPLLTVAAGVTVNDVAFIDEYGNRRSVLAATSAGPYFAPRLGSFLSLDGGPSPAPVWRPMSLPGLSGACAQTPTPIDHLVYEPEAHVLAATTDQDHRISIFRRPMTEQNITACGTLDFEPKYGPCEVCAQGEVLLKVGASDATSFDQPVFLALCSRGAMDGGSEVVGYRHGSKDGGCALDRENLPIGVGLGFQPSEHSNTLAGVDAVGVPRRCPTDGCETMLFAHAPDRVAGGPALLTTFRDDIYQVDALPLTPPAGMSTPLGLRLATWTNLYVAGSTTENQDWMISSNGRAGTQGDQTLAVMPLSEKLGGDPSFSVRPLAFFSRSADLLPTIGGTGDFIDASGTKSFSNIITDAVGTPWVIVGAGDRIWAADSRTVGNDAGVATIGIKVVPMPSADIQSLAFAAFDRGDAGTGPILEGYTVEQQRLFRIVVHSPTLWIPDEIRLGETDTVPVAVWMEGRRGRVGTSDGRVFGLPVPVAISTTVPEAPLPTVLNYGSLCGHAFALTERALYKLSLQTPPLGTWERVSLEAAHPGLDSFGPHWSATMHKARVGNQEHLYLFSQTGLAVELVASCP